MYRQLENGEKVWYRGAFSNGGSVGGTIERKLTSGMFGLRLDDGRYVWARSSDLKRKEDIGGVTW